jgi:hypothetical protein
MQAAAAAVPPIATTRLSEKESEKVTLQANCSKAPRQKQTFNVLSNFAREKSINQDLSVKMGPNCKNMLIFWLNFTQDYNHSI